MAAVDLFVAALKVAAGVAIALPATMYLLQDRLLFHPQPRADARRVALAERFPAAAASLRWSAADGTRLHAFDVRAAEGAPLVLYFGGNAEDVSWMLESVGDTRAGRTPGVSWLLVDYRGYGESGGAPSEAALVADALALYDLAAARPGFDATRTFAFGRSLGSGVAVALAAVRPLAGVALATPYDSLVAVAGHHYPFLPVSWMLRHRFDSIAHAPTLASPLLCLIAGRDTVIPPEHGERLCAAWAGPVRRVPLPGAGHNDVDDDPAFWRELAAFLAAPRPAATMRAP